MNKASEANLVQTVQGYIGVVDIDYTGTWIIWGYWGAL